MAKYIVELKDDELGIPISKNQVVTALAFEFGLGRIVSVENASQHNAHPTVLAPCACSGERQLLTRCQRCRTLEAHSG